MDEETVLKTAARKGRGFDSHRFRLMANSIFEIKKLGNIIVSYTWDCGCNGMDRPLNRKELGEMLNLLKDEVLRTESKLREFDEQNQVQAVHPTTCDSNGASNSG